MIPPRSTPLNPKWLLVLFPLLIVIAACSPRPHFTKTIFNAKVWPSEGDKFNFAEDKLNLPKTGVCVSGGGTRAMVCATGQLRGLLELGLIDDVGYLSCVSGGSWASVPFTYYNAGAANDRELLGSITPPENLTMQGMSTLPQGFLAGAANNDLLSAIEEAVVNGVNPDLYWIYGISKCYMQPFGLDNLNAPKYFSYDQKTVAEICARNSGLKPTDFITVHSKAGDVKRPYLVVNSSISGPLKLGPFQNPEQLAVFNYTPLYVGSAKAQSAGYTPHGGGKTTFANIGGGFLEPFAFGGSSPKTLPVQCQSSSEMCVAIHSSSEVFTAAHASGTSSAAFVADLTSGAIGGIIIDAVSPEVQYWPVSSKEITPVQNFMFGDGGNLENFGLISLLQRKVKNIVVFANSGIPLNENFDIRNTPTAKDIDSDFLPLFGYVLSPTSDMQKNQVFDKKDFPNLMQQFIDAKKNGRTILAKTSLTTMANSWWGISAGEEVNIVWVYNDRVANWESQLNQTIQEKIGEGSDGPFQDFPTYKLIGEDEFLHIELSPEQINLLYQLSAWNVYSNPEDYQLLKNN